MERIDLKAAHEEHVVDVGVGVGIRVCAKQNQRRRGILSTVEFGGRRWTNDEMSPS